jgi:hypothetical protein
VASEPIIIPFEKHLENRKGSKPQLTWVARSLRAIVFTLGVGVFICLEGIFGFSEGFQRMGEVSKEDRPPGVGMAPNLSGAFEGVGAIISSAFDGLGIGLLVGLIVMWIICQFLITPLLRTIPGFTLPSYEREWTAEEIAWLRTIPDKELEEMIERAYEVGEQRIRERVHPIE